MRLPASCAWTGNCLASGKHMAKSGQGRRTTLDSKVASSRGRRYQVQGPVRSTPTFCCASTAFDLDGLVAQVRGATVRIRPQEARLLSLLHQNAGRVVSYAELVGFLYGERIAQDVLMARLKALVSDVRRRFGPDIQSALRTAPRMGLVLHVERSEPALNERMCSDPYSARLAVCDAPPSAAATSQVGQRRQSHAGALTLATTRLLLTETS